MKIYKLLRERLVRLGMPTEIELVTDAYAWMYDRHRIDCKVLKSPETHRFISIARDADQQIHQITSQDYHNTLYRASCAALRKGADLLERRQKQKWPKL